MPLDTIRKILLNSIALQMPLDTNRYIWIALCLIRYQQTSFRFHWIRYDKIWAIRNLPLVKYIQIPSERCHKIGAIRSIHLETIEIPLDLIIKPLIDHYIPLDIYHLIQFDRYHYVSLDSHQIALETIRYIELDIIKQVLNTTGCDQIP